MKEDTLSLELQVTLHGCSKAEIYRHKGQSVAAIKNVEVDPDERRKGYGNELLTTLENIARALGCDYCALWADKSAWVHDWYKRKGYTDYAPYEDDDNFVWMIKSVVK